MLKEYQDAFGQAFYSTYNGENDFNLILERDDGLFVTEDIEPYFQEYKDWPLHERKALRLVRGSVLDIGCGTGRHSLYLQQKGHNVIAVDNSPLSIKVCKLSGVNNTQVMSITKINSRIGRFDTILMLGNNFGLFGNYRRAQWLLKRFHTITNQGTKIIAQSRDPYTTTDNTILAYHKLNRQRGRMSGQIRLRIRYKHSVTPWADYLLVSMKEMDHILENTGWQVTKFFDAGDSTYIAIIEKL